MSASPPTHGVDLFSEEVMAYPYDAYKDLRATGPAVRLTKYDTWVLPRYDQVRAALSDHTTFSSVYGVGYEPELNAFIRGSVLTSNPPEHDRLRAVLSDSLGSRAMRELYPDIRRQANELVTPLVQRGSFDAATELAKVFPVNMLVELLGLPAGARDKILRYTDASYNVFGPFNELTRRSLPLIEEMRGYLATVMAPENLDPDGMVAAAYAAADRGEIAPEQVIPLLTVFLVAGMDTTISGIGSAIMALARRPDAWRALRADPSLVPSAFEEALRLETPVQHLFRVTTRDVDVDGVTIPLGERVLLLFGSANRDERQWKQPDQFDVTRDTSGHLAFGQGLHGCVAQALARVEGQAVLEALTAQTAHLELAGPLLRRVNNMVRGFTSLPVQTRRARRVRR